MSAPAVRSRLLDLRQSLERASRGRDLLDHKREIVLRALAAATAARDRARNALREAHETAAARLAEATVEAGAEAIDAVCLAQPAVTGVAWHQHSVAGVATLRLEAAVPPFRARYGLDGTSASTDAAGAAFTAVLPLLLQVAEQELAVRRLQQGLNETTRRLRALENVVLPDLRRTLREVASSIEEEERTESAQRKHWLRHRAPTD